MANKPIKGIKRTPVESSNIKSIGYSSEHRTLEIEFKKGSVYQYNPITQETFNALMAADSKGGYFAKFIKVNELVTVTKL